MAYTLYNGSLLTNGINDTTASTETSYSSTKTLYLLDEKINNEVVVAALPTENIQDHTIYIIETGSTLWESYIHVPSSGETPAHWVLIGWSNPTAMHLGDLTGSAGEVWPVRPESNPYVAGDYVTATRVTTFPYEIACSSSLTATFNYADEIYMYENNTWVKQTDVSVKTIKVNNVDVPSVTGNVVNIEIDPNTGLKFTEDEAYLAINRVKSDDTFDENVLDNLIPTALLTYNELLKKINNEIIITVLPTEDIKEHTLYILDKGNDKYETYIHDLEKGWILIGSPEEKPMKVANVDETMTAFPTQRPDGSELIDGDWVVSAQTATYPFDLTYGPNPEDKVTFTEAGQKAVYNKDASEWTLDVTDGIKKVKVDGQVLEIDPTSESVNILLNKDPETLEYDTTDGLSVLYDENHGLTCNEPGDPDKGIKVKFTKMTQAEWDALTPEQQAISGFVKITDGEPTATDLINDNEVSLVKTWSSQKLTDELAPTYINTIQLAGSIDSHTPIAEGGLGIVDAVKMTQAQYDALGTYDENRIYVIID